MFETDICYLLCSDGMTGMHAYVQTHQIIYICSVFAYQLHLKKSVKKIIGL